MDANSFLIHEVGWRLWSGWGSSGPIELTLYLPDYHLCAFRTAACGAFVCSVSLPKQRGEHFFLCQGGEQKGAWQQQHDGHIPTLSCFWGWCFGSFRCLVWHRGIGARDRHVLPYLQLWFPQLLSLHFAQLNIKASKHFSSSAQHCLPNYPPAGLSYCASYFPGCWQPLACMPQGKPWLFKPLFPPLSVALHCLGVTLMWDPKAELDCLSLFKGPERAVCSLEAGKGINGDLGEGLPIELWT